MSSSSSVTQAQNRDAQVREFLRDVGSFWQTAKKITIARQALEQFSRDPSCENPEERLEELGAHLFEAISQTNEALVMLQRKHPWKRNILYPSLADTHDVTDFRQAWNQYGLPADCNPF